MFDKLDHIEAKYKELTDALSSPEVMGDSAKYQKTAKAHSEVSHIYEKYREYKDLKQGITDSTEMLASDTDAEIRDYTKQELTELESRVGKVEEDLKLLLVPKDPNDERNV